MLLTKSRSTIKYMCRIHRLKKGKGNEKEVNLNNVENGGRNQSQGYTYLSNI